MQGCARYGREQTRREHFSRFRVENRSDCPRRFVWSLLRFSEVTDGFTRVIRHRRAGSIVATVRLAAQHRNRDPCKRDRRPKQDENGDLRMFHR
jgi:hypothetical protein